MKNRLLANGNATTATRDEETCRIERFVSTNGLDTSGGSLEIADANLLVAKLKGQT